MSVFNLGRDRYAVESGTFAQEYADKLLAEHKGKDVIDHPDGSVTTEKLGNGAVTGDKLASGAVTEGKLGDDVKGILNSKVSSVAGKRGDVTLDKSDVGLGNVNNTSDYEKEISWRTQEALDGKVDIEENKALSSNDYTDTDKAKLGGIEVGAQRNTVLSVAGKTGAVTLSKSDVGLGNVNNTADLNKPISYKMQAALDGKAPTSHTHLATDIQAVMPPTPIQRHLFTSLDDAKATVVEGSPITGAGETGTALELDGSSAVKISPALVNFANFTISFKIKTTQAGRGIEWFNGIGVLDADTAGWRNDFGFALMSDGCLLYGEGDDNHIGETKSAKTQLPINDGQWHRITLTRGNGKATMYMDSVFHNEVDCFTTRKDATTDYYLIGNLRNPQDGSQHFVGMIDDLNFYSTVEPPVESLAEVAKTGIYQDLANWKDLKAYIDDVADGGAAAFNSKYDYVINEQADFDNLIASDTWLGATRILFNTDIDFNAGSVVIPQTVKCIDGNSHTINVNYLGTENSYAFTFDTKPTDFSMGYLNVNLEISGGNAQLFQNVPNIHDCAVYAEVAFQSTELPLYSLFYECDNLSNVHAMVNGTSWTTKGHSMQNVYYRCDNMVNCSGYISGASSVYAYVYESCSNLCNCEGYINDGGYEGTSTTGAGLRNAVYGYCANLTSCTGTLEANDLTAYDFVYYGGKMLSNCTASTAVKADDTTNITIGGFSGCSYASNCRKGNSFTGTLWGGTTIKRDDDSCDLE